MEEDMLKVHIRETLFMDSYNFIPPKEFTVDL